MTVLYILLVAIAVVVVVYAIGYPGNEWKYEIGTVLTTGFARLFVLGIFLAIASIIVLTLQGKL